MDRSAFSRIAVAVITGIFLLIIFFYRQYQVSLRFDMVGVVEGFYGNPWTHNERLDMIRFMGDVGMNTYFYAPKDDPYHRRNWRESYTGEHLERFQELVRVASDADIRLYYAISPGLSIRYSDPADYIALREKLFSMNVLGVEHFALFLDDVPEYLQHDADRSVYANLAEAHVSLINQLYADLKTIGADLVVCPTTYTDAWGDREYVRILGEGIPTEIPLFWTGTDVAIGQITDAEALNWGNLMSRKPLIWDNFPVNDFEVWRPIIGPITGREAALAKTTTGLIANPMDKPYLSMIPLYTVAEFGRKPFAYDEKKSWQNAITYLAGAEASKVLRPLALLFADYGWTDNVFTPLYTPGKQLNIYEVRDAINLIDETINELEGEAFSDNEYIGNILNELRPFAISIQNDFESMLANRFYRIDAEGFLVFQSGLEEIITVHKPVELDGRLNEWDNGEFKNLYSSNDEDVDRVQAAFRVYEEYLYIGLRVQTNAYQVPDSDTWVGGDQVLFAFDFSNGRKETWIEPTDLLLMIRPPDADNNIQLKSGSFYLTPFSQRGISDIRMRTISSFFDHFIKDPHPSLSTFVDAVEAASSRTTTGYEMELRLPVHNRSELNLTISVNDARNSGDRLVNTNFMLSNRPYIGNPNTYITLVIK